MRDQDPLMRMLISMTKAKKVLCGVIVQNRLRVCAAEVYYWVPSGTSSNHLLNMIEEQYNE